MAVMSNAAPFHVSDEPHNQFVDARFLAAKYKVSSRYILLLAEKGRIPCLRLGKKCVRFSEAAVAEALEDEHSEGGTAS